MDKRWRGQMMRAPKTGICIVIVIVIIIVIVIVIVIIIVISHHHRHILGMNWDIADSDRLQLQYLSIGSRKVTDSVRFGFSNEFERVEF